MANSENHMGGKSPRRTELHQGLRRGGLVGAVIGLKPGEQWEEVPLPEIYPTAVLTPEGGVSLGLSIPLKG